MSSDDAPFRLNVASGDGAVLLTLAGELDMATAPELWAAIDTALGDGHTRIVLDLAGLGFVDSTGLGVFVRAGKELRGKGGGLTLRSPGERVAKLLEITHLQEVFEIE